MMFAFHRLPTILLLGALVPIFWFLRRSDRSPQVRFWVIAWSLVLLRTIVQVFGSAIGLSDTQNNAIDLGGLQLSGVVLAVSMTRIFHDPRQRWPFFLMAAVPSVTYVELFAFGYQRLWVFALLTIVLGGGVCAWILLYYRRHVERYMLGISGLLLLSSLWGALRTLNGRIDLGFYTIECATYALAGFLYWYSYKRLSPGVVLASAGFFAWAAVFPVFYLVTPAHPKAVEGLNSLANIPKFWVAIGMIVTLLEDKSRRAELAEAQERATREQIQGFFQVTSRLLSGADVASFCDEIANVVTGSSNFARAAILLTDDQSNLYLAGSAGLEAKNLARTQEQVGQLTVARVEELCEFALKVGTHSYRLASEQFQGAGSSSNPAQHLGINSWQEGDKILVPLVSTRGSLLGCLLLDEPREVDRVDAQGLTAVEMLSTDLAISIENSHLQRQLVVSEKLAGLGKLIAGTGHELNNPLTAVLGYAEMLSGSAEDEGTRRSAEVIRREALRMKQIIENLLSFARQTKFERRPVSLAHVVQEVLKLRSYEIRHKGLQVTAEISSALPGVLVDEGMLKQVFLNVINNSIEALRDIPGGRIAIEATQQGERMQLRFSDNGPGFSNPDRVFDPFFTTKDPGKGPGLGLSVSYGIVKQHSGEITAYNLHPSGACILIELPMASAPVSILEASGVAEA